ncbi:hypothetical protein PQ743_08335 [Thermoanaerobacterium thermosaccharolyticum]
MCLPIWVGIFNLKIKKLTIKEMVFTMKNIKYPISDEKISRLILKSYFEDLYNAVSSDVIITGAGPSGLYCAILLAKMVLR